MNLVKRYNTNHHQYGVGMVEVLITLFILSVGLLGVASLQFVGSFNNADALNRTQAVMVAQQFSERLRANAAPSTQSDGFVVDNAYFNQSAYNFSDLTCSDSSAPYDCFCKTHHSEIPNCESGECTPDEFAEYDAYQMSCAAVQTNPNVEINLTCEDNITTDSDACSAGSLHNIIIRWPAKTLQNHSQDLRANCNPNSGDAYDCVILEVTL